MIGAALLAGALKLTLTVEATILVVTWSGWAGSPAA
jgi:hypothetical protein